jgi:hypothetical protein
MRKLLASNQQDGLERTRMKIEATILVIRRTIYGRPKMRRVLLAPKENKHGLGSFTSF